MNYLQFLRKHIGHAEVIINCSAVWIENENGVLLERRGDDGNWGLIGGIMELGESPKDVAIRETLEETGAPPTIEQLIGVYSQYRHEYPNGDKAQPLVFFFRASINPEHTPRASRESMELRYFQRDSLPVLGMQQHRDMLADALAGISNKIN